ncbi:MAG: Na+/H+ antiporter subunit E [Deltaproteobacteria bacterium]|nr:Na+/H+ antiporter subunit E [Deltaproteobacteria bacterium]MBW2049031.1 Na+/H+ antiporter subunit E [Deltaproteobacteria bacterium]MBW2112215.1 Na+/H+ antiporter subunit E [Deltaproteobacteria bacterium]MBW2353162.1 Na+/H+ antiporter subunit E [Deltaproteobacteria bacterium]HDZ90265.1 protein MnhE [Deltaproteobacteria bacterium]
MPATTNTRENTILHEPGQGSDPGVTPSTRKRARAFLPYAITFILLFSLWIVLSGKFDPFHLSLGLISCVMVTLFSKDLIFPEPGTEGSLRTWVCFIRYVPWLLYQIFMANLHVLYLTFHPRMMDLIDPRIFRFQSRLKGDLPLVTFANSITLTPGTITVYVSIDGTFTVHALDKSSRESLPGEMERRIARAFGEE